MINIARSQPVPACLDLEKTKANGSYKCGDVVGRIHDDFHGKCYLCEENDLHDRQVEHLIAHKGDLNLKFDWENLFLSCSYCNNVKNKERYHRGLLNCTDPSQNVLEIIKLEYLANDLRGQVSVVSNSNSADALKTRDLLEEIFVGNTETQKLNADSKKKKVEKEIKKFTDLLLEYYKYETGAVEKLTLQQRILQQLSLSAPFTAFKYWIMKSQPTFSEFEPLLEINPYKTTDKP